MNTNENETQSIFAEYERINLVQAQEIARLRDAIGKFNKLSAQKAAYGDPWDRGWSCAMKAVDSIFRTVQTGDTLPAAEVVNLNEKGN